MAPQTSLEKGVRVSFKMEERLDTVCVNLYTWQLSPNGFVFWGIVFVL